MKNNAISRNFDDMDFSAEALFPETAAQDVRLQAPAMRVKANKWLTPERFAKDGKTPIFSAKKVMSFWGNGKLKAIINAYPEAELAIPADENAQNLYYKSTIGVLAVAGEVHPVNLETLNTDGEIPLALTIQHALIDTRENKGTTQIRFR